MSKTNDERIQWLTTIQGELRKTARQLATHPTASQSVCYTIQYAEYVPDPDGEWVLMDIPPERDTYGIGNAYGLAEYIRLVFEEDCPFWEDYSLAAQLLYYATQNEHGLYLECPFPHVEGVCDCDAPQFDSWEDALKLAEDHPDAFADLYKSIAIDDPEVFAKWAGAESHSTPMKITVRWKNTDGLVYLTREAAKRGYFATYDSTRVALVQARAPKWDDIRTALTLLADVDLNASTIVLKHKEGGND